MCQKQCTNKTKKIIEHCKNGRNQVIEIIIKKHDIAVKCMFLSSTTSFTWILLLLYRKWGQGSIVKEAERGLWNLT